MDTKNNSDTDNNVLTKFQPMPKRFTVWDDEATDWICVPGTERDVWSLLDLLTHKTGLMRHKFHMRIIQSTGLFDKDGKEIFEGSIVQDFDDAVGVVYYDTNEGAYLMKSLNGDDTEIANSNEDMQLLGHILSNPELLEEK